MKKKNIINQLFVNSFVMLILCCSLPAYAQNVCISGNGSAPHVSAMLDVTSTTSGFLVPRMTQAQRDAIATPATGLLIYQTNGTAGFWYYNGSGWVQISGGGDGWKIIGNTGTIAGTNFIGTTDAVDWVIKTNNTERARVLSGGNFGIGTSVPGAKLEVAGPATGTGVTIRAAGGGDVVLNSGGSLFFDGNYSYAGGNYIRPVAANTQAYFTSGSERMRITSTGNIGMGTTTPNYNVEIGGSFGYGIATGIYRSRTETRNDAGLRGDAGAQSGFFETSAPAPAANWPTGASSWWHLIDCRHSNSGNYYALQIAGSFWGDELYYRKTQDNPARPWKLFLATNNAGNTGQILVSQGAGNSPVWQNPTSVNMYGNNASSITLSNLVTTTNTSTWEDINGMSVTFTPAHSVVYLFSSLCARLTDNSSMAQYGQVMVKVRMLVNGVEVAKVASIITDYDDWNGVLTSGSVAFSGVRANVTIGAATTVKLQWYVVRLWSSTPWRVEINPGLAGVADHCVLTVFD